MNKTSILRKLVAILASSLLLAQFSVTSQSASAATKLLSGAGFYYTMSGNKITIMGCTGRTKNDMWQMCPKALVIPTKIGSGVVVAIAEGAFAYIKSESAQIPDSVTSIGKKAFFAGSLQSVSLGKSIRTIGDLAFARNSLKSVSLGNSIAIIAPGAFAINFLTEVTFPASISKIGNGAFDMNRLLSVTFLGDAPAQASKVFNWDPESLGVNDKSRTPVVYALKNKKGWGDTWSEAPVQKLDRSDFLSYTTTAKKVTVTGCKSACPASLVIPNKIAGNPVTSIASQAFKNAGLSYVVLPEAITNVGNSAFSGDGITSVYLLGSAPSIGNDSFGSISESTKIRLAWNAKKWGDIWNDRTFEVDLSPFFTTEDAEGNLTLTTCRTHCDSNLVFPAEIGGKPVRRIGEFDTQGLGSFADTGLLSVEIPNSVTAIGDFSFVGNQLTTVEIPSSVKSIGESAFSSNLITSVKLPDQEMSLKYGVFRGNDISDIKIPSSWKVIPDGFLSNNKLQKVVLPPNLEVIGENAFFDNKLTSVSIPSSVREIKGAAFVANGFTKLPKLPTGLTVFNNWFSANPIKTYVIQRNFTEIGDYAFSSNRLTSFTIPDWVTKIGVGAFQNNKLTTVTIPSSVTNVASSAFQANKLTSVKFEGNAPIPQDKTVFRQNTSLKELSVKAGTTGWGATWSDVAVKVLP